MGTTLTGTTPQDTYDSLIKVTDNGPLSGTLKLLSDGLGNDSALALSTSVTAIRGGQQLRLFRTDNAIYGSIQYLTGTGGFKFDDANGDGFTFAQGANTRLAITSAGNVGIGTSAPEAVASSTTLQVNGADHSSVRTGTTAFGGYLATIPVVGVTAISNARNPITGTYNNTGVAASVISLFSESANAYITFSTATANNSNPSERVRVTSNGLTFNGDTAAANALDDYEEGTWTMGVSFGNAAVGVTYAENTGTYTKIGRQVTVNGYLSLSDKGSSTGIAKVTGLPFTIGNTNSNYSAASLWLSSVQFTNQFQGYGETNTTRIELWESTVLGTTTNLTNADFSNTSGIILSLTYFV